MGRPTTRECVQRALNAGDDVATQPYQLSHAIFEVLVSAVDHLETLRLVVQDQHVLPARGGFTAPAGGHRERRRRGMAALAAQPGERVVRLLRWEWADAEDEEDPLQLMAGMTVNAERAEEIRTSAQRTGGKTGRPRCRIWPRPETWRRSGSPRSPHGPCDGATSLNSR